MPCALVRVPFYIVLHTDSYNKVGGRGATRAPLRDFIVGAQLPCVMPYDSAWMYHAADTSHPPFRLLATSSEFCLASAQDASDCESVQFISGIELEATGADKSNRTEGRRMRNADTLLMSYGINDCEAKLARMPLSAVLQMLKPLTGERAVCTPVAGTRP